MKYIKLFESYKDSISVEDVKLIKKIQIESQHLPIYINKGLCGLFAYIMSNYFNIANFALLYDWKDNFEIYKMLNNNMILDMPMHIVSCVGDEFMDSNGFYTLEEIKEKFFNKSSLENKIYFLKKGDELEYDFPEYGSLIVIIDKLTLMKLVRYKTYTIFKNKFEIIYTYIDNLISKNTKLINRRTIETLLKTNIND